MTSGNMDHENVYNSDKSVSSQLLFLFSDDSYNDFVTTLLSTVESKECRYAVYDFEYTHNQMSRQKLVFVLW